MKKVIILLVGLAVIGAIIWFAKGASDGSFGSESPKYAVPADAADAFYGQWLKAAQEPSATPNKAALASSDALTSELGAKIAAALQSGGALDPVLCQKVVPQGITLRNIYQEAEKAQMLVTSRDKSVTNQAIVELIKSGDNWVISGIQCSEGEFAPPKEFSFEEEGFLLKNSIPKPFNNKNWHIIFTKDGKPGNVVPLIFDAKSKCVSLEGATAACKPEQFAETSKVRVKGQMTERGAVVVRMEFVQ